MYIIYKFITIYISEKNPPCQAVVESGVIPKIIDMLTYTNPSYAIEAAWCVTNLSCSTEDHIQLMLDYNVVPILLQLLFSNNEQVRDHVIWALSNLSSNTDQVTNILLSNGILEAITTRMGISADDMSVVIYSSSTVSNSNDPLTTPSLYTMRHVSYILSNILRYIYIVHI